jgi:hypothetical protein
MVSIPYQYTIRIESLCQAFNFGLTDFGHHPQRLREAFPPDADDIHKYLTFEKDFVENLSFSMGDTERDWLSFLIADVWTTFSRMTKSTLSATRFSSNSR